MVIPILLIILSIIELIMANFVRLYQKGKNLWISPRVAFITGVFSISLILVSAIFFSINIGQLLLKLRISFEYLMDTGGILIWTLSACIFSIILGYISYRFCKVKL